MSRWLIALVVLALAALVVSPIYASVGTAGAAGHFRGRINRFKFASRTSVRERLLADDAIGAAVPRARDCQRRE